jgi:CheY-like chemotaxis protein
MQLDPYDVLLIDADMPDLDGIDTLHRIAEDAELAAVPAVLMVTAYSREHDKDVIEQTRNMPFLDKPANPQQLRNAVLSALGLEASQQMAASSAPPSLAIQRIRNARVLVVDDNSINQQVASEILQRAGVKVDLAASGEESARMIDAESYDAVLMDIQMPDMDGYQSTALIRKNERHAALPIIAMTAHAVAGYRERCLERGMNDYVTKPIDPDTLYAVLATWVQPDLSRAAGAEVPAVGAVSASAGMPVTPRAGIDMQAAMERLGGHGALLVQLLGLFAHDFESTVQQIHDAIHAGELARAADLVHKIRGAAGNLSANELFATSGALEDRLRAEPQALADLLRDFVSEFDVVMASARSAVATPETEVPEVL